VSVFSPEGSELFLRANAALKKFDADGAASPKDEDPTAVATDDADDSEAEDGADSRVEDDTDPKDDGSSKDDPSPKGDGPSKGRSPKGEPVKVKAGSDSAVTGPAATEAVAAEPAAAATETVAGETESAAQEDEAQGQPEAVDGHERAAATTAARPVQQPFGHFVEPTAVAVVPAAPVRRPAVGGFDFFGTKSEESRTAFEAVQNEDLADVVGQEALALHKAETEAQFKPADEEARGVGQVIDLTAHDETEQINVQGLRSAAS
jgi:hypothetical protein